MSATFTEARADLSGFMRAEWITAGQTADNIYFENNDSDKQLLYSICTVRFADRDRAALGQHLFRTRGVLYLQMFIRRDTGTEQVDLLGDALVTALEVQGSINGIRLRDVSYLPIGLDSEDQAYFQAQVRANFEFDVTR